MVLPTSV